ncbi:SDR family NAD(P)-dependent oxidoreductase [Sinorhizobium meliloti]|uniref:SDR family NAD(P)-dependent oxidoreductase n=1 Tax=Rhizobium meliloti TaxID=382 RepID=UPI000FD50EEF|nr:SDR family NAD(P)-dependent oxidoreductase [Sinorhizobium meliloti]RVE85603.1 SDR family NAD(P)-dependent oxidoreductase [Sinorhizobium meliloti]RVE98460.1 SDR family NAD(P)-dependent oxidoreductase [Sinorhizobium meliloti]RVM92545.1 SDR family NAD(P)-dependent oxidoreductase [Sinorhizobium meliloti]
MAGPKPSVPICVFVTGASSGFGAAITRQFAGAGARVVAAARRADRIEALAREFGDRVLPVVLDITDTEAVSRVISDLPIPFRDVDCLVNNAGLALGFELAQHASLGNWDRMLEVNCRGLIHMTRALLPGMVARGRGHIVNIGSFAASIPYPGGNVYGASKAFVQQFSQNLRSDLHGSGVRVTVIEPGLCGGTEFSEVRCGGDRDKAAALYSGLQPLTAGDIAETVRWVTAQPSHVNVNIVEVVPVAQSVVGSQFHRVK